MGSTGVELDNLGVNLKKVREKFMEWTGDSLKTSRLEDKENHENVLLNGKGTVHVCKRRIGHIDCEFIKLIEFLCLISALFFA